MQLLKKRSIAMLIAVVVIALSTLLSVHRSLGAKCAAVEEGFYSGLNGIHSSISYQLNQCARYANSLASLSSGYSDLDEQTDTLRTARNLLLDGGSISEQYDAYLLLIDAFSETSAELGSKNLGSHTDDYDYCVSGFEGACRTITASGYNESVREFQNTTLRAFPANLLYRIAGVDAPELFA